MTEQELVEGVKANPRILSAKIRHHADFDDSRPHISVVVAQGEGPKWKSDVVVWMPLPDEWEKMGPDLIATLLLDMVDVGVEEEAIPDAEWVIVD